jgi:hypothetical protein
MTITELDFPHMDDEDTTLAPSEDKTEAVHAWSLTETTDLDAPTERYSWGTTWLNAGAFIAASTIVAVIIGVLGWTMLNHSDPAPQPTAAEPIPTAPDVIVPTPPAPTPIPTPAPQTPDEKFIAWLKADNLYPDNPTKSIYNAHATCDDFSRNIEYPRILEDQKKNSGLPAFAAADLISIAVNAYCPQYAQNLLTK